MASPGTPRNGKTSQGLRWSRRLMHSALLAGAFAWAVANAQGTSYDQIYRDIGSLPCVRLLDNNRIIGCQAMKAKSGVLYRTDKQSDIDDFIDRKGRIRTQYTIVMPYWLMTDDNLQKLDGTKDIAGVLAVVNGTDPVYTISSRPNNTASPDTTCPNCEYGLYSKQTTYPNVWNPTGTGLLFKQYDFPIYALNTIDERNSISYRAVIQSADFNHVKGFDNYPLSAIEFHSFMWAAQSAEACLRKVTAAMDSRSFFHDLTIGVESSLTGMIAVLATAEALSRSPIPLSSMQKHIVYSLFSGEAWGFGGSQRFVKDISAPIDCIKPPAAGTTGCLYPFFSSLDFSRIQLSNIDRVYEVSQVGLIGQPADAAHYLHVHNSAQQQTVTQPLVQQMIQLNHFDISNGTAAPTYPALLAANADGVHRGLPPTSAASFLGAKDDIPTVVMTGYQKTMSSLTSQDTDDLWDPVTTVNAIQRAANVLARTTWLQAQGVQEGANTMLSPSQQQGLAQIAVDRQLVQDLLTCMTSNYSCPLVDRLLNVTASPTPPSRLPHYSGTLYSQSQPFPIFVWSFLANATAAAPEAPANATTPPSPSGQVGCSSKPGVVRCSAGEYCVADRCIVTMTRYHDAYGLGISMNQDNDYFIEDASKPVWVESTWDPIGLRLFTVTSPAAQRGELGIGLSMTIITIAAGWYAKRFMIQNFNFS
ncbi:hypothetical protein DFQ27_009488 [Actinomortierella ambigua]|uniref:Nicastrin n=1 Tax=Actinomortierella ambigua TaxID=1343610 RepID=A0A9P6UAJ4_9FUNG|nr:hypothetical protein DFQ27_009488 [Actinomortierella ambigua]